MIWLPLKGYLVYLINYRNNLLEKTIVQLLKKTAFSTSFEIFHDIQPETVNKKLKSTIVAAILRSES